MSTLTKKQATAAVVLAGLTTVAGLLATPVTAHAADLDCDPGQDLVHTIQSSGAQLYTKQGESASTLSLGEYACTYGDMVGDPNFSSSSREFLLVDYSGQELLADPGTVTSFPQVETHELSDRVIRVAEDLSIGGLWNVAGKADPGLYPVPASAVFSTRAIHKPVPGEVFTAGYDPDRLVSASAGLADGDWMPLEYDDSVAWAVKDYFLLLPSISDTSPDNVREFTVPDGWEVFSEPGTPDQRGAPLETLEPGTALVVTKQVEGWSQVHELAGNPGDLERRWLLDPAFADGPDRADDDAESDGSSFWDDTKEKAGDLYDAGKDKAGELADSTKKTAVELRQESKALTLPAMVASSILSGVSVLLTLAGMVLRPRRGLGALTPAGFGRNILAYAASPASVATGIVALAVAPAVWGFPIPVAIGAVGLASVGVAVYVSRLKGGHQLTSVDDLKGNLVRPFTWIAGAGAGVISAGTVYLTPAPWWVWLTIPAVVVAAVAGAVLTGNKPTGKDEDEGDAGEAGSDNGGGDSTPDVSADDAGENVQTVPTPAPVPSGVETSVWGTDGTEDGVVTTPLPTNQ